MTFDYKKPFTTRDGRKARLLADDLNNSHQLVVAVETPHMKIETIRTYRKDGTSCCAVLEHTLVNIPERKEYFVNVYEKNTPYSSRKLAKYNQGCGAAGVLRIVKSGEKVVEQEYFPNEEE